MYVLCKIRIIVSKNYEKRMTKITDNVRGEIRRYKKIMPDYDYIEKKQQKQLLL